MEVVRLRVTSPAAAVFQERSAHQQLNAGLGTVILIGLAILSATLLRHASTRST